MTLYTMFTVLSKHQRSYRQASIRNTKPRIPVLRSSSWDDFWSTRWWTVRLWSVRCKNS